MRHILVKSRDLLNNRSCRRQSVRWRVCLSALCAWVSVPPLVFSDAVAVRHREGQGFLLLRTAEGKTLEVGEEIQTQHLSQIKADLGI